VLLLDETAVVLPADDVGALAAEDETADVEEVAVALDEAGAELLAGAAVATQEQTARAEDETCRPVTAPQALSTQLRAALAMAEDWELLHWQAKSV
jgi:hypothetical protein